MNDDFLEPFDQSAMQGGMTPDLSTLPTFGTSKMLAVIFVIDCSRSMDGDRIGAVNAAMREMQYRLSEFKSEHALDLKMAVMSFASSAKWEIGLTPIDEVNMETIQTRPGLTSYGAVFHELDKVLSKEAFMRHTGKIAPPAIVFLTDGEPNDDYHDDLDDLLENRYFAASSRSAVLLGDAIDNPAAKDAVDRFVNDSGKDIVAARDAANIIDKIELATLRSVKGEPMTASQGDAAADNGQDDPIPGFPDFSGGALVDDDVLGQLGDRLGKDDAPSGGGDDPFGGII